MQEELQEKQRIRIISLKIHENSQSDQIYSIPFLIYKSFNIELILLYLLVDYFTLVTWELRIQVRRRENVLRI
jgi:hypothetical protein